MEMKKDKKIIKCFLVTMCVLVTLGVMYTLSSNWLIAKSVSAEKLNVAVGIYNIQLYRGLLSEDTTALFIQEISESKNSYFYEDDIDEANYEQGIQNKYEEAIRKLKAIERISDSDISSQAEKAIVEIDHEHNGRTIHAEAEKKYGAGEYFEAIKLSREISGEYSQYEMVEELGNDCVAGILGNVDTPNSVEDYENYINTLENYLAEIDLEPLANRKDELVAELEVYKQVVPYIGKAEEYVQQGDFLNAVKSLKEPTKKYPKEQHLASAMEDCCAFLVFDTVEKVDGFVNKKDYKQALKSIEDARNIYACEEFDMMYNEVKKMSNPLYKISSSVKQGFVSVASLFKKELANVKKEGGVAYVKRSGEKILLGDYSRKEVSVLSCAGSGVLSIAGLDVALDVRDLAYDIQHIGQQENWVVWLAVDTVAIIPVVGMVKYLKYSKKTGKMLDQAADVTKGADNAKGAAKVLDSAKDALKKAGKNPDDIASSKLGKVADSGQEAKHVTHINTVNQNLKGKKHPKTGVKFASSKVELSDGTRFEGVFPRFKDKFKCKLPADKFMASDAVQFAECTRQLRDSIKKNPKLAKKFKAEQLEQIMAGKGKIKDLTWHHNEQEGVMQLVDAKIHKATAHTGGKSIWGGGRNGK